MVPGATGRFAYHPATLLKVSVYGHLNRVRSSRRLERETQVNVEMMWLTGRLMPDHKTISDFRKDNRGAIVQVCAELVPVCRELELLSEPVVAIDGSKFKAVNHRDRNVTAQKMKTRLERIEKRIERYLGELDEADAKGLGEESEKVAQLEARVVALQAEQQRLEGVRAAPLSDARRAAVVDRPGFALDGYRRQRQRPGRL